MTLGMASKFHGVFMQLFSWKNTDTDTSVFLDTDTDIALVFFRLNTDTSVF